MLTSDNRQLGSHRVQRIGLHSILAAVCLVDGETDTGTHLADWRHSAELGLARSRSCGEMNGQHDDQWQWERMSESG